MDWYALSLIGGLVLATVLNLFEVRMLALSFVLLFVLGVLSPQIPDLDSWPFIALAVTLELVIVLAGILSKTRAGVAVAICSGVNIALHILAAWRMRHGESVPDYNASLVVMESLQVLAVFLLSRPIVSLCAAIVRNHESRRNDGEYRLVADGR